MNADSVLINGGNPLNGKTVSIHGSKNSALPILAATTLYEQVTLTNVPDLLDIRNMLLIHNFLGTKTEFDKGTIHLDLTESQGKCITSYYSDKLRASSLFVGPLLAKYNKAEVGMPGGCAIGARPLDYHFNGFKALGATVTEKPEEGIIEVLAPNGLAGEHELEFASVGATENLIMASVFSPSKVTLHNVAREPEIIDLINFLNKGGAKIKFTDYTTIEIEGVKKLSAVEYKVKPDRIEAGTFLMAAFATKGAVTILGADQEDLGFVIHKLREMGASIEVNKDAITLKYEGTIKPASIKTAIYPGFPTDLQPQMSILMTQAEGTSKIDETIFENRLTHVSELIKMGATVAVDKQTATIEPSKLTGAVVESFDLRGAAAMIIAGLCADGTTRVTNLKYLYRGYENFIEKLKYLGADIAYG